MLILYMQLVLHQTLYLKTEVDTTSGNMTTLLAQFRVLGVAKDIEKQFHCLMQLLMQQMLM
jgi:hypothetical protein